MSDTVEHLAAILTSIYRDGQCEPDGGHPDGTLVSVADAMPRWAAESEPVRVAMRLAAAKLMRAVGMVAVPADLVDAVREAEREAETSDTPGYWDEVADGRKIDLANAVLAQLGGGR